MIVCFLFPQRVGSADSGGASGPPPSAAYHHHGGNNNPYNLWNNHHTSRPEAASAGSASNRGSADRGRYSLQAEAAERGRKMYMDHSGGRSSGGSSGSLGRKLSQEPGRKRFELKKPVKFKTGNNVNLSAIPSTVMATNTNSELL